MSYFALKMDSVSKLYRLGEVGTGTVAHDLNRWWAKFRGKEDPNSVVGGVNDRSKAGDEFVWALKDVDFEVQQGEIVGIIGRNGAGKSTLLKLLSRVTAPTKGSIQINGKIASLLEVGTGFHPELTGRENIFLNGAILGMSKKEIQSKFDEIVDFSGCAKYIDTPVKRYSSGMHVRLAFAVAAHLEPDILIVDEVLAVGDVEFQQKCINKMEQKGNNEGKTILFVSHNMTAIRQLCPRSILLETGSIHSVGPTDEIISKYLSLNRTRSNSTVDFEQQVTDEIQLIKASVRPQECVNRTIIRTEDAILVEISYKVKQPISNFRVILRLVNQAGIEVFDSSDYLFWPAGKAREVGKYISLCTIPGNLLNKGTYYIELTFDVPSNRLLLKPKEGLTFVIAEQSYDQTGVTYDQVGAVVSPIGVIHPKLKWNIGVAED